MSAKVQLEILIIAHYFPPDFRVGARRPYYMAQAFKEAGHRVNVFCAIDPAGNLSSWDADLTGLNIFRLPLSKDLIGYSAFQRFWSKLYWKTKSQTWLNRFVRTICFFVLPTDHHQLLDITADREAAVLDPDLIIATGGPWSTFEMAVGMKKEHGCPVILDYRDAWNVYLEDLHIEILQGMGKWPFRPLKQWVNRRREKRIGASADAITSVSENVLKNCRIASGCSTSALFYNGYGPVQADTARDPSEKFEVTFTGTINKEQDLETYMNGVELFFDRYAELSKKVQFNFIGVLSSFPNAIIPLTTSANLSRIKTTEYLSLEESWSIQQDAQILVSLGWRSLKGILGSKIFEYMRSEKPVLLVSQQDDGKESLLKETNIGVICRDAQSIADTIAEYVMIWEKGMPIPFSPDRGAIVKYSYKAQMSSYVDFALNVASNKEIT